MKPLVFAFVLLVAVGQEALARSLNAMTWNIRYNNPGDGVNAWPNRKDWVAEIIIRNNVDISGFQECKRRREIVALGGGKVQRLGCGKDSLERGWRLVARGLFIDSTLHQSRLSPSSVFFSSHHEVGSSGRRLRGCGSGASDDPESHLSVVRC